MTAPLCARRHAMDGHPRARPARLLAALVCLLHLGSAPSLAAANAIPLLRASSHPISYYLSLPRGYSPRGPKRWPVLVCIAGADADFAGLARRFAEARGDRPFLIVVPCTFSGTNVLRGPMLEHYQELYDPEEIHAAAGSGWPTDVNRRLDWDEAGL